MLSNFPNTVTEKIPLLDHGYIQVIEGWGCDERIVEAARMSTQKGFEGWGPLPCDKCDRTGQVEWHEEGHYMTKECPVCKGKGTIPGDEKLLHYLYTHWHETPFEFAGFVIEVQAPIMVFREWHRHRTQSYNEMSARYEPLPDVNYVPTMERCFEVNTKNKQANAVKGASELTHKDALNWLASLEDIYALAQAIYERGLQIGIPKELARLPVPVGRYSRMRASTNLRNWLAFMTLRSTLKGPNAQKEIRVYADAVGELAIKPFFPRTWELFVEGRR